MSQILITLITAGEDTGPFNLYSNIDGYIIPFETLIDKASLETGYISTLVPESTTSIRILSINGLCSTFVDAVIDATTTTTTTVV